MKRLILVLNGKGGVGKSFVAVNLVQCLKDRRIPHLAIDTDHENSTLKRFHPDAQFLDLSDPHQFDGLFLPLQKADLVVVDGRAAASDLFLDAFDELDLSAVLDALGATLTLVIPVNHEADSVDQVQRLVERLGDKTGYVIVRNAAHSPSFTLYDSLEIRRQLLGQLGAREMDLPRLPDWLVEALHRENLTPTGALQHPAFHLLDRQRLKHWQRMVYAGFERVGLVPPPSEGRAPHA